MGRLFWKFFAFLFLAQFTSIAGVSLSIWLGNFNQQANGIEISPPARSVVEAAAATLRFGGIAGLTDLLETWHQRRAPQVYVVDETGHELLQRELPAATLAEANEMVESWNSDPYIRRVEGNDGHHYLLFVPKFARTRGEPGYPRERAGPGPGPGHGPDGMGEPMFPRPLRLFPFKPLMAGTLVSFLFALLLAWYFSKPIKSLRKAFEEAANGHLDVRVGNAMGSRSDELADLGRDFDTMAGRLGSLIRGQTRLLHHVSHELRSPLARLQMAIGLARQSADKIPSSLERIERESVRMDKLVGELLELSRLESGVIHIERERIDINELLASVVEDAKFEATGLAKDASQCAEIWFDPGMHFVVQGQPDLLHRAIENVVRNALKYSPPNGDIRLDVSHDPLAKTMQLSISDQGPGVPNAELESIFQPFVRGSTAQDGEGHGVGLAIAKQVVEAHGGTITASNRARGGLLITVVLPYVAMTSDV